MSATLDRNDQEIERTNRLRVWPAQHHEGHCEGCGTAQGVQCILAGQHQVRFCKPCLKHIVQCAGIVRL